MNEDEEMRAALGLIVTHQKAGGIVAFVDCGRTLDLRLAAGHGVNVESLLVSQPDNPAQAVEIVETLVRSGAIDLVVVDACKGSGITPQVRHKLGQVAKRTSATVHYIHVPPQTELEKTAR